MITSFKIENFKGFCELELPQLSRITLLGGSNNVGKTSVLEAMHIFLNRYNRQLMLYNQVGRGITVFPNDTEAVWEPNFRNYDLDVPILFSGEVNDKREFMKIRHFRLEPQEESPEIVPQYRPTRNAALSGLEDDEREMLEIRYSVEGDDTPGKDGILFNGNIRFIAEGRPLRSYPTGIIGGRMDLKQDDLASMFSAIDIENRQETAAEFLRIIEPDLKSLSVVVKAGQPIIYGDIGISRKIPIANMGDGMSRLLAIVLHIANTANGTLLVDEVENGLHHSVMAKVWEAIGRAAREFNCQIIATTHSFELLQGALIGLGEAFMDDFAYIRLDRIGDKIVPKHLNYERLETALEYNMEIR